MIVISVILSFFWLLITGLSDSLLYFCIAEIFNAFSIVMYGGTFTAYLVDTEKRHSNQPGFKKLLGRVSKYPLLAMAVSSFIGASFIGFSSNHIWFIAAFLSSLLFITSIFLLPSDTQNKKKQSFKRDFKAIIKSMSFDSNLRGTVIIMIAFFTFYQVLIQFWQPILALVDKISTEDGIIYGSVFLGILLVQSFAGLLVEKLKESYLYLTVGIIYTVIIALILNTLTHLTLALIIMLYFFCYRIISLLLEASFQVQIEDHLRATYSAFVSTVTRGVLLIAIPCFAFLLAKYRVYPSFIVFSLILILFFFYMLKQAPYKEPK